ncbi:hypothetical protein [Haloarcula onubensis]|uniref:Uncharacterized protein n=1 Tax=Haloarcula onubensis TaxID=2950539 RepID=A0ABU2FIQ8_9EURY|nr:hypothetical protein [Halomicroarcula sp. S3CR25-11]MDS0280645.1 hypothetical protein [Halomicroarcula sp. S3CR25-11]
MSRDISDRWPDAVAAVEIGGPVTELADSGERVLADGGAVDHDYDESELPPSERIGLDGVQTDPIAGGIAFDLVTRQPLFVRQVVAPTVVEYYEREGFDLLGYKTHPYLPVRPDDTVYECVFITRDAERAHKPGDTYDFPRGRLMHVPVEQAWGESE